MLHIEHVLYEKRNTLPIDEFNKLDHRVDALILEAAARRFWRTRCERFTLYRHIG